MKDESGRMKAESEVYRHELQVALRLAREAGAAILEYYDKPLRVERKESRDLLSYRTSGDYRRSKPTGRY